MPLVASGRRIDVTDKQAIGAFRRRMATSSWQESAAVYNAMVPHVGFGHDYVRDSMSRVRPVPAILSDDPEELPVTLTKDTAPDGLDPDLCDEIVQRLAPFPYFMGRSAWLQDIFGEFHVAIIPDDEEEDGERVRVLSHREISTQGDEWRIRRSPGDNEGLLIPAKAPFWRVWQNSPEWEDQPFSHMVRLEAVCERYLALARLVTSYAKSRIATTGKIIVMADEFSLESAAADGFAPTEDAGDGEAYTDTFFDDFMASGAEAIMDPDSAAAVMNLVVRGPADLVQSGINVVDISRTMEDVMLRLRAEAVEEMATGMNLPREVILGVGDTNHWNAEQIKEQSWLNHLEPRAYAILAAATTSFYRPVLRSNDIDPDIVRRCVLWYDPTWFLGVPDRAENADYGYDNYLLSGDSWRAAKGFDDDDAPGDDEIAFRVKIKQDENVRTTLRDDGTGVTPPTVEPKNLPNPDSPKESDRQKVPDKTDTTAPPDKKGGPTPAPSPPTPPAVKPKTASARPSIDTLGDRHVVIERDARARLLQAADAILSRALERAGMKVRSKVVENGRGTGKARTAARAAMIAQVEGVPAALIPSIVGREAVEAFGLDDQRILDGALGDLEVKYRTFIRRAQHAAAKTAAAAVGAEFDYDRLDAATEKDRDAGWAVLSGGLLGLATSLLYDPHPEAPPVGEYDGSTAVPPGLIRASMERAGGTPEGPARTVRGADIPSVQSAIEATTDPSGGATAGPTMLDEFNSQLGITNDGYVWVYGDAPRSREFEPHLNLDGETFATFEDDILANNDDFPDYDYLFPGDHNGCGCDASQTYTQADDTTTLEPGLGVDEQSPLTRTQEADAADAPRRERGGR